MEVSCETNLFSYYKRKFISKVTKVIEVSQLGCIRLGTKLQKQKKGHWNLGERKAKVMYLGGSGGWRAGLDNFSLTYLYGRENY